MFCFVRKNHEEVRKDKLNFSKNKGKLVKSKMVFCCFVYFHF